MCVLGHGSGLSGLLKGCWELAQPATEMWQLPGSLPLKKPLLGAQLYGAPGDNFPALWIRLSRPLERLPRWSTASPLMLPGYSLF